MAVIYTFIGVRESGKQDIVNVETYGGNAITATLNNGGGPALIYEDYLAYGDLPDVDGNYPVAPVEGDIIYQNCNEADLTVVRFNKYFPFGVVEVIEDSPSCSVAPSCEYLTVNETHTDETESGLSNGTITATTNGISTGYSLDGIFYQVSNVFTNLLPGTYNLTVRASDGCLASKQVVILAGAEPITPPNPPITPKDVIALSDAEIEIQNAYKRVRVLSLFGKAPSVITNGDFEVYDGQNWEFWVKYGNISVSRIQRTVTNSTGLQVPIQDYALRFNQVAQQSRYIQHSDIPVQSGDTLKIQYRVGKTAGTGTTSGTVQASQGSSTYDIPATYSTFYISKIRIKCGNYYLYNADYGNSYVWVNQVATISNIIDNPQGDLSNFLINFNIPECPVTGALIIQLFGFQKIQTIRTEEYKPTPFITFPATFQSNDISQYDPIDIDDISASKSSQNGDNDIDGILSISDNLRVFSEVPETKELLFGDYFYRADYLQPLDNLYAIKYNGKYTEKWYEYTGATSDKVAFGLALAKSILTGYQKPFRKWNGSLQLREEATRGFAYLDVFSFDVVNSPAFSRKQFVMLGGDFNLKTRQLENGVLAEIFDRAARSSDNSVPSYPNMPDPDFVQDPNANTNNGIFTEEFTQEFN